MKVNIVLVISSGAVLFSLGDLHLGKDRCDFLYTHLSVEADETVAFIMNESERDEWNIYPRYFSNKQR